MTPIQERKAALRREVGRARAALEVPERERASRALEARVLELEEFRACRCLFCYVSTPEEPDTRGILRAALEQGKRVGVPLCTGKGIMEVRELTALEQLRPGKYGILEPDPTLCPLLPPEEIQFSLIPCVSCSHAGDRLGHGGGYYDRYLTRLQGRPVALLCWEALVRPDIPTEAHDLPLRPVVTDAGVFR